jgi:hypothetical protein
MKKLIGLLVGLLAAVGAVVTILFFWRKKQGSWSSMCSSAKDTTSSWGTTAADEAGKAADKVTAGSDDASKAASNLADELKGAVGSSQ